MNLNPDICKTCGHHRFDHDAGRNDAMCRVNVLRPSAWSPHESQFCGCLSFEEPTT